MRSPLAATLAFLLASAAGCSDSEPSSNDGTTPGSDAGRGDATAGGDAALTDDAGNPVNPDGGPVDTTWNPPTETGNVTFPYRAYKCAYSIRQVSPAKPTAAFHDAKLGSAVQPKNLHLTFAGDPTSSVVVQWSTDDGTMATEVHFGESPTSLDKTARGFSFTYGVTGRREHEVHLCGLAPGKTYYYEVLSGAARSGVKHFTLAPAGASEIKVLVLGDSRTDPSVLDGLAPKALADAPQVMVLSGDAVATGGSQSEWDALFSKAPDLWANVPGIWAHGNHEGLSELYFAQLAQPDHGGAAGIEQWFSINYGPMHLVVLNDTVKSGSDITAQASFLDADLGAMDRTRTPFAIAMHHQPMYTTSLNHGSNTQIRGAWMPAFDKHHVNVDIAGHVHSYESTLPLKGGTSSSEGQTTTDAQGTRFFNFGGAGAPLYNFLGNQAWILKRESTHGYATMTVNAQTLGWAAHRGDGSTIETLSIPK